MQRNTIVFDQDGWRREPVTFDQFRDRFRPACIRVFAVKRNRHDPAMTWSQSFQTGSSPRPRKTFAISAAERSSLISN